MNDLISRQSAIDTHCELCADRGKCPDICPDVEVFRLIAPAQSERKKISEEKMKIVIENYFKDECDVNTSIKSAFEKGFRTGVKKGMEL